MVDKHEVTWVAGLFEGEGSFSFHKGSAKAVAIQMTDLDVLEKVRRLFGGKVYSCVKQEQHHKDIWVWRIGGTDSIEFVKSILPYLMSRRKARGLEYLDQMEDRLSRRSSSAATSEAKRLRIKALRIEGKTHKEIAEIVNVDRSYVTHVLSGRYDN